MEWDELRAEHGRRESAVDVDANWGVLAPRLARVRRRRRAGWAGGLALALATTVAAGSAVTSETGDGSVVANEGTEVQTTAPTSVTDPTTSETEASDPTTTGPETTPPSTSDGGRFNGLLDTFGVVEGDGSTRIDIPMINGASQSLRVTPTAASEMASLDFIQQVEVACGGGDCGYASVNVVAPGHGVDMSDPVVMLPTDTGEAVIVEDPTSGRTLLWEVDGWLLTARMFRVPVDAEDEFVDALTFDIADGWPQLSGDERVSFQFYSEIPILLNQNVGDDPDRPLEVTFSGDAANCTPGTIEEIPGNEDDPPSLKTCLSNGVTALVQGDPDRTAIVAAGLSG